MKKRSIGILICLMLCLALLPSAVFAAGTEYKVWVNGEQFTSEKLAIDCGSGTATLDVSAEPYVLTLDGAAVSKTHSLPGAADIGAGIYTECALKVVLASQTENVIAPSGSVEVLGIYSVSGDITITGAGKLDITTNNYSIYAADGSIDVSCSGDVSISSERACIASSGSAEISCSGNVTLNSEADGIYCEGGVLISCSGDVEINADDGYGILSNGNVYFSGEGKIAVTSNSSNAIYFYGSTADHLILNGSASPVILKAGTDYKAVKNSASENVPGFLEFDSDTYTAKYSEWYESAELTIKDHYRITLDLNGGTVDGSSGPVVLYTVNGKLASLPEPAAPTGKAFRMWIEYADSKLGDIKDTSSTFTEDTTLIAGYDVVFDEVNILIDEPLYTGMELDDKISVDGHPEYNFGEPDKITWLIGDTSEVLTPAVAQKGVMPTAFFRLVSSGSFMTDGDISTYHTYRFKEDTVVKVNGKTVDPDDLKFITGDHTLFVKYTFAEPTDPEVYDIKVNGMQISDANKTDVLGGGSGVVYDPLTRTLTLGSAVKSIESNLTEDLKIVTAVVQSDDAGFTLTAAGNVEITGSLAGVPLIEGPAQINAAGDITMENRGSNGLVWWGPGSTDKLVLSGKNITLTATTTDVPMVSGVADITATGDVLIENAGNGGYVVSNDITINSAGNVTVTASTSGAPALACDPVITASGDVTIKNVGKGYAVGGTLTVNSADNLTVSANGNSQAITGNTDITVHGNVAISSASGMAITGNLTVNSAKYVEVTGGSSFNPVITGGVNIHADNGFTIVNNGEYYVFENTLTYDQLSGANAQGFTSVDAVTDGTEIASGTWLYKMDNYKSFRKITLAKPLTIEADKTSITGGGSVTLTTSLDADSVTCDDSSISVTGSGTTWTAVLPNAEKTYTFTAEADDLTAECTVSVTSKSSGGSGDSSPASYKLTFNSNGGSAVSSVSGSYGKVVDLGKYVPEKDGFEFGGWCSDKELTKPVDEIKLTGNKTVYAKWNEKAAVLPFTDVSEEGWSYDDVCFTWEKGLMQGTSDTQFAPKVDTSRAMIVTILWRLEGEPVVNYAMSFDDVPADMWYTEAVRWAQANGIVEGYTPEKFGPANPVTREQLAAIFYRYAGFKGYDLSIDENTNFLSFNDFWDTSEYAKTPMMWSLENDLIEGSGWDLLPQAKATREQTAAILHRFFEKFVK